MSITSPHQNVVDLPATDSTEELERILRLVQFARASALDIGEHNVCSQLVEVEQALAQSLDRQVATLIRSSPREAG